MDTFHREIKRECGGCTICCFTHGVQMRETYKPQFTWCEKCTDNGCSVYFTAKPSACDEWECGWKAGWGSDEDWPKATGIVPVWRNTIQGPTLILSAGEEGAFNAPYARTLIQTMARKNKRIQLRLPSGRRQFVFLAGSFVPAEIRSFAAKEHIDLVFIDTA